MCLAGQDSAYLFYLIAISYQPSNHVPSNEASTPKDQYNPCICEWHEG